MGLVPVANWNKPAGGGGGGTLLTDLLGCFEFEETVKTNGVIDSHTTGNDGTFPGGSNDPTINQTGKVGGAYLFTGDNNVETWINLPVGVFQVDSSFSISFWYKHDGSWATTYREGIFGGYGLGNQNSQGGIAMTHHENGNIYFDIYDSNERRQVNYPWTNITPGTWYHIMLTYSEATDLNVYIDNVAATNKGGNQIEDPIQWDGGASNEFRIGSEEFNWACTKAYFSQFAMWSRVLTSTERGDLYNSGSGLEFSQW